MIKDPNQFWLVAGVAFSGGILFVILLLRALGGILSGMQYGGSRHGPPGHQKKHFRHYHSSEQHNEVMYIILFLLLLGGIAIFLKANSSRFSVFKTEVPNVQSSVRGSPDYIHSATVKNESPMTENTQQGSIDELQVEYPETTQQNQEVSNQVYYIQVEVLSEREHINALTDMLKEMGLKVFYLPYQGMMKIYVGTYSNRDEAEYINNYYGLKGIICEY